MQLPALKPGDYLLYDVDKAFHAGFLLDWIIRVKTWSRVAHVEVYAGDGRSVASRATGVDIYPLRTEGLIYVVRPRAWKFDWAWDYFQKVRGQKYDYAGLLCFTLAVKQGAADRQFCSEFGRNLARAAAWDCFNPRWPGDKTAPGNFLMAANMDVIYAADENDPLRDDVPF